MFYYVTKKGFNNVLTEDVWSHLVTYFVSDSLLNQGSVHETIVVRKA